MINEELLEVLRKWMAKQHLSIEVATIEMNSVVSRSTLAKYLKQDESLMGKSIQTIERWIQKNLMQQDNSSLAQLTCTMDALKDQKARLKFELQNTEDEIKKIQLELEQILSRANADEMHFGIYRFGWVTSSRKAFDQSLFGKDYPELLEKYKVEKETKKFEFKINQ